VQLFQETIDLWQTAKNVVAAREISMPLNAYVLRSTQQPWDDVDANLHAPAVHLRNLPAAGQERDIPGARRYLDEAWNVLDIDGYV